MNELTMHDVRRVTIKKDSAGETWWTSLVIESVDYEGRPMRFSVTLFESDRDHPIEWAGR